MKDLTSSPVEQVEFTHLDILTRIALRRERFVALIMQLTGASVTHAEQVFRPLPFIDSRRVSQLAVGALSLAIILATGTMPAQLSAQSASLGACKDFTNDLVLSAGLPINIGGK